MATIDDVYLIIEKKMNEVSYAKDYFEQNKEFFKKISNALTKYPRLTSRNPNTLAAAVVYLVCKCVPLVTAINLSDRSFTQRVVADIFNVEDRSVRTNCRNIISTLGKDHFIWKEMIDFANNLEQKENLKINDIKLI